MGGRTNNAGDWLTGKSQAQYDQQESWRQQNVKLLRSSGYTRGIDERTGQEVNWRDYVMQNMGHTVDSSGAQRQAAMKDWTDEEWRDYSESQIANFDKAPLDPNRAAGEAPQKAGPPPVQPDFTDAAVAKARTSAWNRLQLGKNQKSSFAMSGKLGGFDVSKPVLGGY